MTQTVIVRKPYSQVAVNGGSAGRVLSLEWVHGLDQRYSTAEIVVPTLDPSWAKWSSVVITAGATRATAAVRFMGKLVSTKHSLFPRGVTLICRGSLYLADFTKCTNAGGIDLSNAGAGQTDEAMVAQVLGDVGLGVSAIGGTGTVLGTVAGRASFNWAEDESALSFIEKIDECSQGFSTFDSPGGSVYRIKISPFPRSVAGVQFTEGVDIFRADKEEDIFSTANRVKVTGYNTGTGTGTGVDAGTVTFVVQRADPAVQNKAGYTTSSLSNPMIEREKAADAGAGFSCEDVATYVIQQVDQVVQRLTFDTPRDDAIIPGSIIGVSAPDRLGTLAGQTDTFFVQNVRGGIAASGEFTQSLTCLGGTGSTSPIVSPPVADFTIIVEQELVVIAGVEQKIWIVYCTDASVAVQGTIVSWAWSSAGTPPTGSGKTYTTIFTHDPSAETITLTVTDSNGTPTTVSKVVGDDIPAASQVVRKIYTANKQAEDFDGAAWRLFPDPHAVDVFATTNGPLWAAGKDAIASDSDLATAPTVTTPFGSSDQVSSLWVETDADDQAALAGAASGKLATSDDAGATWHVLPAVPDGLPILRCAADAGDPNHFFALTASHCYHSYAAGVAGSWAILQAALAGESFVDLCLSHARSMIAMHGGRLMIEMTSGVAQAFPGTPAGIYAVTADILVDRFFAIDEAGLTYYTTVDGGAAFSLGAALPVGAVAHARSIWRDGKIESLLYLALGTGGAWKSVDGFATAGGYYQLRKPGVGNCPGAADYRQIGVSGDFTPIASPLSAVLVGSDGGFFLREGPDVWRRTDMGAVGVRPGFASPLGSPDVVYAAINVGSGVFKFIRSDDQCDTFTDLTATLPAITTTYSHATHRTTADKVTWVGCPDGAPNTVYISVNDPTILSDVSPPPASAVFYYAIAGVWKSLDGGATWAIIHQSNQNPVTGTWLSTFLDVSNWIADGPLSFMERFYTYDLRTGAVKTVESRWPNSALVPVTGASGEFPDTDGSGVVGLRGDSSTVFGFNSETIAQLGFLFLPSAGEFYVINPPDHTASITGCAWIAPINKLQVLAAVQDFPVSGPAFMRVFKGNISLLPYDPLIRNVATVTWTQLFSTSDLNAFAYSVELLCINPALLTEAFACFHYPNVYRSPDKGTTWFLEALPAASPPPGLITGVVVLA